MSTYSLSGSGTHSLTADTTGLQVTITTIGAFGGVGRASPIARYDQGLIRFSDGTSYWPPVPILGGPQFIPVPQNATSIGYALLGGCVVSVTEVIGGTVFFSAGTPSIETLSDVAVSGIADGQVLEWIASASKWENRTPSSGGGGILAFARDVCTSDVAMAATATFYDGPSVNLGAGTWFVTATLTVAHTSPCDMTAKLWDGTTAYASVGQSQPSTTDTAMLVVTAIIVLTSMTTIKGSVALNNGSGTIKAADITYSAGNVATQINALQVA
jgi:hypothetical protein